MEALISQLPIHEPVSKSRYVRVGNAYVCAPAKNGSTSLRCSMFPELANFRGSITAEFQRLCEQTGVGPVTAEEAVATGLPVYLAVRHPAERFRSFWQDMQRAAGRLAALSWVSVETLLRVIAARPFGDPHWVPQSWYWHPGVEPVPYTELLQRVGKIPLHMNTSRAQNVDMPVEQIIALYPEDLALWEAANG